MDYYLQDKDRLEGQPKRTIADYVEQNGILVPRRFDSLAEARRSNKSILLRSEHTQEYDGVSGLLESFDLSSSFFSLEDSRDIEDLTKRYFERTEQKNWSFHKQYCQFFGLDEDVFKGQVTFSIWEALGGFNRTIVADSSIPGRHHVMTLCVEKNNWFPNYAIVQDGTIEREFARSLPEDLRSGLQNLIELYEQVRHLERFDPNHCPIMEFQTCGGRDWFLQYHRTRDFSPASFRLEREPQDGEIEVPFVRGATPEEGIDCKTTVYYSHDSCFDPQGEDGSFDFHYDLIFSESQFKKRVLQAIDSKDVTNEFLRLICGHNRRSKIFKPEISAIFSIYSMLRDNEVMSGGHEGVSFGTDGRRYDPRDPILKEGEEIFNFSEEARNGQNSYMDLHVVSDGRRAFVKRLA